jgi:hypothetical protein
VPRAAIPIDVAQFVSRRVVGNTRRLRSARDAQPLPPPEKLPPPSALRLAMQSFAALLKFGVERIFYHFLIVILLLILILFGKRVDHGPALASDEED